MHAAVQPGLSDGRESVGIFVILGAPRASCALFYIPPKLLASPNEPLYCILSKWKTFLIGFLRLTGTLSKLLLLFVLPNPNLAGLLRHYNRSFLLSKGDATLPMVLYYRQKYLPGNNKLFRSFQAISNSFSQVGPSYTLNLTLARED